MACAGSDAMSFMPICGWSGDGLTVPLVDGSQASCFFAKADFAFSVAQGCYSSHSARTDAMSTGCCFVVVSILMNAASTHYGCFIGQFSAWGNAVSWF